MKLTRNRIFATAAAATLSLAGLTFALAPAASAASGGGCAKGSAGPAETVYSCISAPAYAEVVGDAYVYMSSAAPAAQVRVLLHDDQPGRPLHRRKYGRYVRRYPAGRAATQQHPSPPAGRPA
jgi:hypothetical protein